MLPMKVNNFSGKMVHSHRSALITALAHAHYPEYGHGLTSRVIIEHEFVKALSNCLQVPEQVTRLTALTELNVGNNTVARLPPQLGLMHPTLKRLLLEGNPIRTIRQAILQKETPAVLECLRDRIPAS